MDLYELLDYRGDLVHQGVKDGCYMVLQRKQGASAGRALSEGWKINKLECLTPEQKKDIIDNDGYVYLEAVVRDDHTNYLSRWVKVWYEGKKYLALKNAMVFKEITPGKTIHVMRMYLKPEEE